MPRFPLYFEAKDNLKDVQIEISVEEQEQRSRDQEIVNAMNDYYEPHRQRWRDGNALMNLVQTGTNDVASNWYLGWGRILLNHSVAMMSGGPFEPTYTPVGPSDYKKRILWNSLTKHALNKCNWQSHQRQWVWDMHACGNGTLKNFSELPMRKKQFQTKEGKIEERFVRDFRRAKVGIRRRSPFRTMRSHLIADPDEVNLGVEWEDMSWNSAAVKYGNAVNFDGTKKYNTDEIPVGTNVRITHIYDELSNEYRVYWLSYGTTPESKNVYQSLPLRELGKRIYKSTLSKEKTTKNGKSVIEGVNVQGLAPLSFGIFDDQLDGDYETFSICGMGIPQIIEGPESIMQALVNMTIDNVKLKNTVALGYKPNSSESPSHLSLDPRTMYSGFMVDGQITANPLGVADVSSNSVMWDWLRTLMYQLTGINPDQISGDNLKTAFQSGLVVRQMNMRTKSRMQAWGQGPLKRAFTILLSDCLSELTQSEWEQMTEDDAKRMAERIEKDEMTGSDFDPGDKEEPYGVPKRKVMFSFPVAGRNFKEDFTGKNKIPTLDQNSADNTLIEEKATKGQSSILPARPEYMFPNGEVESTLAYDTEVDAGPVLIDLQQQDMATWEKVIQNAMVLKKADPNLDVDFRKLFLETVKVAGKDEKDVMQTAGGNSKIGEELQELYKQATTTSPTQDGSQINPSMAVPAPNAGTPPPTANSGGSAGLQGGPNRNESLLGGIANGLV